MKGKEFWKVSVGNTRYSGEGGTFYVLANCAATAEKRALRAANEKMKRINGLLEGRHYALSAERMGWVY